MGRNKTSTNQKGIYIILNRTMNKVYVGQCGNFTGRVSAHKWRLNSGKAQKELQQDWNALGSSAFEFTFLWSPKGMTLTQAEQLVLNILSQTHKVYNKRICTNPSAFGKAWKRDPMTGAYNTINARPFKRINIETEEEKTYSNIKEAVADGYSRVSVLNCLAGRREQLHGCFFEYV